jgi:ATP-dependent Zn protease
VSWQDHEDYLAEAQAKTVQLLKRHWPWVEAVARALLERKTLSREEILSLRPEEQK